MVWTTLETVATAELISCWVVWMLAFLKPGKEAKGQKKVERAPASRWGIFLVTLGFACSWAYIKPRGFAKPAAELVASMILGPLAVWLVYAATRHLGKQWRYEAALSEEHDLITTGPYSWLRHPIYASMFAMLLATLLALTWWPMLIASLVLFVAGTEIRVHAEERLLMGRFPAEYAAYRRRTKAYIPFLR
jgi:protein-S-isoprenylcysteine O-methyltransferase Ste14